MTEIYELCPHDHMTPEQALGRAARNADQWADVLLIGFDRDGDLMVQSSHISRELALWLIESAKAYVMQTPMPGSVPDTPTGKSA